MSGPVAQAQHELRRGRELLAKGEPGVEFYCADWPLPECGTWRTSLSFKLTTALLHLCHACHEPLADHPRPGMCRARTI